MVLRITPAYAGKSSRICIMMWIAWDHPRVCGEKQNHVIVWSCCLGSPPRMRGKGSDIKNLESSPRITPAYAGKRITVKRNAPFSGDHPRVCGEKHAEPHAERNPDGITPAYAGKSKIGHAPVNTNGDHPRVCGEKVLKDIKKAAAVGSPPRMRGKGAHQIAEQAFPGDHPRVCGEKFHL